VRRAGLVDQDTQLRRVDQESEMIVVMMVIEIAHPR
jgi:hypothetical protein